MAQDLVTINVTIKEINSILRARGFIDDPVRIILPLCYLTLDKRGEIVKPDNILSNYCEGQIYSSHIYEESDYHHEIDYLFKRLSSEEIRTLAWTAMNESDRGTYRGDFAGSGPSISKLVYHLLRFDENDIFYDLGSGLGNVLLTIYAESRLNGRSPVDHFYGSEINVELATLSKVASRILIGPSYYVDFEIMNGDALRNRSDIKYTKGYVYLNGYLNESIRFSRLYPDIMFRNIYLTQWQYIDLLLANLDTEHVNGCRAVAVVFGRTLAQTLHNEYVQHLLHDGWIEGVIELPPVLPNVVAIPYMIVFSKKNESVKMFRADSDQFISNSSQRTRFKPELNIEEIMRIYDNPDNNCCKVLTCEQLSKLNTLIPSRIPYFSLSSDKEGYAPIDSLAEVMIGCQYTASSFARSTESTGYKILTSSDIENGMIKWDGLSSVKVNKTLFDKYMVYKGDLIVTTKSSKVKTAVVDIEPDEKVIVTGGMIIVRPKPELLNPTYLKMYLDSDEGIEMLRSTQTGTTIVTISLSEFKKIGVPKLDIEKQNKKANKYNDTLSTIGAYRKQISKLEDELSIIVNEDED